MVSIPFNQRRNIQEYFLIQRGIPEECGSMLSVVLRVLKLLRSYLLVCFVTKLLCDKMRRARTLSIRVLSFPNANATCFPKQSRIDVMWQLEVTLL